METSTAKATARPTIHTTMRGGRAEGVAAPSDLKPKLKINKLNFYYGFYTNCTQSSSRTNNVCFLNCCVKHSVIAVFFCQRCRFAEHTTESSSNILSEKNCVFIRF